MGMNFGFSESFKSIVNSFVRNEKGEGAKGPNKAKETEKSSAASAAKAMDAFQMASESMEAAMETGMEQMQENVNFTQETMAACDWAAEQSLAEAVDHFENPQVGNSLMLMSLIPGFNGKKRTT